MRRRRGGCAARTRTRSSVELVVLAVKADAALHTAAYLADEFGSTPVLSVASELRFTKQGVYPVRTGARSQSRPRS